MKPALTNIDTEAATFRLLQRGKWQTVQIWSRGQNHSSADVQKTILWHLFLHHLYDFQLFQKIVQMPSFEHGDFSFFADYREKEIYFKISNVLTHPSKHDILKFWFIPDKFCKFGMSTTVFLMVHTNVAEICLSLFIIRCDHKCIWLQARMHTS